MTDDAISLGQVIALIEKHGTLVMPSRSVEKLAPIDARVALTAAGILAAAPAAASWPCDVRGCAREIRANRSGARKALVAICSQAPPACAPVELGFDDVAQQELAVDALVAAACALLGAKIDPSVRTKLRQRRAIGEAQAPVLVASLTRPRVRDVFWAATPRDMDLAAFGARRERIARKTLVLVPTARHVPLDVAARYARGEAVEIAALEDLLVVRAGKLALMDDEAPIAPDTKSSRARRVGQGIATEIGAAKWEDIKVTEIDERTLRIECVDGEGKGAAVLRTFVELGFVDSRKKEELTPVIAWSVLRLMLAKGRIRPSEYASFGKAFAAKKGIAVVRRLLKASFGLKTEPMLAYRAHDGWRPRFRVGVRTRD